MSQQPAPPLYVTGLESQLQPARTVPTANGPVTVDEVHIIVARLTDAHGRPYTALTGQRYSPGMHPDPYFAGAWQRYPINGTPMQVQKGDRPRVVSCDGRPNALRRGRFFTPPEDVPEGVILQVEGTVCGHGVALEKVRQSDQEGEWYEWYLVPYVAVSCLEEVVEEDDSITVERVTIHVNVSATNHTRLSDMDGWLFHGPQGEEGIIPATARTLRNRFSLGVPVCACVDNSIFGERYVLERLTSPFADAIHGMVMQGQIPLANAASA